MQPLLTYERIYSDDRLHLASLYVRHFLATAHSTDWLHVMVRGIAYDSFLDAMLADPASLVLPYSCWCDGGDDHPDPRYRRHRHMIVVSPTDHFGRAVWPRVRAAAHSSPHPQFACKRLKPLRSPLVLVNTLGELSQPTTRCQFSFRKGRHDAPLQPPRHNFYIFQSLPHDYRLPLVLLWPGGLRSWLHETTFSRASALRVAEHPLVRAYGRWQQQLKHFYALERGLVLPLCAHLVPTLDEETPLCLHLFTPGRRLYLKHVAYPPPPPMSDAWMRSQAERGNCFYEVVHEEFWVPAPALQEELDRVVPLQRRVRALLSEHAQLMTENAELEKQATELELRAGALEKITAEKTAELENQSAQLKTFPVHS